MANIEMNVLKVGDSEFEIVDAQARQDCSNLKDDFSDVVNAHFRYSNKGVSSSVDKRGISDSGSVVYDASKTGYMYKVTEGELIYLNLNANTGYLSVWEFTTASTFGALSASNLVGSIHTGAVNGMVRVPNGATYLAVAQATGSSFIVADVVAKDYQTEIDNIADGAYERLKGDFEIGSILNGANTSTTTRVRHAKPISYDRDVFIFVKSGYKYYVAFYGDAQGTNYLYTREFVTDDLPIIIKANYYIRMVICKTTEETVTDINGYVDSIRVTTQLFNNPQIYKNNIVRQVAHQGLSSNPRDTAGHCLVESYINAALAGFTHGECDIVFSADGVPFCCHDASFVDATTGDTITISAKTSAELVTYNYYGGTVASFDDVVKTCKMHGMGIYIDHLDGSWTQGQWDALFAVVNKYNMAKNAVWLIPAIASVLTNPIKTWNPDANIGLVVVSVPTDFSSLITDMITLKTASNFVSFDFYTAVVSATDIASYTSQLPPSLDMEVWMVDNISDWYAYLPYVSGITSNRICANIARKFV